MRRILSCLAALLWSAAVCAANALQFGPPPAWVKPVAVPPPGHTTQAALKILLVDRQVKLTSDTVSYYVETVSRIQTPQGLSALGTLTLQWDPDTDVLIVHKVDIICGGKVINVLASGQQFTIAKRETNLAYATLDDTLSAILQPAGLRVGDTLEVAYTLERTDPVMAGHPFVSLEQPPNMPVSLLHLRLVWPASAPIRWHASRGLAGVRQFRHGATAGLSVTLRHVRPILQPAGAPLSALVDRRIDVSSFRSWGALARLFAPLYRKAAQLPPDSPLRAQIARIRVATSDPKRQAALALRLVQNKVRYVFLDLNQGGLVPAPADLTWARRFGDCKAKTVLLLALLHGLNIEAEPVLVNTLAGDGLERRLPMMLFNHVLVRARIGGKTYWLDGTRVGDRTLDHLHTPYDHWGLPLTTHGARLVAMVPRPLAHPLVRTTIRIDASGGISAPAPFHVETTLGGDAGLLMKLRLANMTSDQIDAGLRQFWAAQYDFVHIQSVAAGYDEQTRQERLQMTGTARMDWRAGRYQADVLAMGYHANFERQPGPHRNAPYAVFYPSYKQTTETIVLPGGGLGFTLAGADVQRTVAGTEFRRRAQLRGNAFIASTSWRSVAPEFPARHAVQDQKILHTLDRSTLYLVAPRGYRPSPAQSAWGLPKRNGSAQSFARSAMILLDHGALSAAMTDIRAALQFDADNADALATRGLLYTHEGHPKRAAADFDAVLARHPHSWRAEDGRGVLAYNTGNYHGAIEAFTAALRLHRQDTFALSYRATAYARIGRMHRALADIASASLKMPKNVPLALNLYWMRAFVLQRQGRTAAAAGEAKALEHAYPKSPVAYYLAAAIYRALHEPARAHDALRRGFALNPSPSMRLTRVAYRPWADLDGRRRDIEAALKAEPASPTTLMMLAQVQEAAGENAAAIASLSRALHNIRTTEAIVAVPPQLKLLVPNLLALRAVAYAKSGRGALARRDFAAAHAKATNAVALNNLCWRLGTAGVSLHGALSDCNAALARHPYVPAFLDSRAMALLRLGRYHQAIASYDAALRLAPQLTSSLFGRGICELRTGHPRRGRADLRLAEFFSFAVADQFAHYGIRP